MTSIFTLNYHIYALLFNFVCCSTVTLLVLGIKRDSKVIKLFAMFTGEIAVWAFFYWASLITKDAVIAELLFRACMIPVVVIPASFFHFITELTKVRVSRNIHYANYSLSLLLLLTVYTSLFAVTTTEPVFVFLHWPEPGPIFPIHVAHFVGIAIVTHIMMFKVIKRADSLVFKRQVSVVFWGTVVAFGSGTINYLTWYRIYPPLPNPIISFYTVAILYAVFKHQLMDIEVVIKRTVVFAGMVASAAIAMVVIPRLLLQRLWHWPQLAADLTGVVLIAGSYRWIQNRLTVATDHFLFQKKYDYKELLKRFTDEVMLKVDLKQLVETTVNTLVETVKLQGCSLLLLNKDRRTYELVAAKGANGQHVALGEQEQLVTFLRETHEPVWLDSKVAYPQTIKGLMALQLKAQLCLPLHLHEDLIGILCLGKKKSDETFAKDDLDILLPLARTLAIAITNAQLFDEVKASHMREAQTLAVAAQKDKLATIGTLSAGINHEICNPLGIVKAQCEAFLLDAEDGILIGKSQQDVLERTSNIMRVALKQIDRATAITQKLSNFAKPIKELRIELVSVDQEIDEVLVLVNHDLKLEKIEIMKEVEPELPQVAVDRRQLQEVLFNLIRNAGQAIQPPGTVWVRARSADGQVRIEIADTGSGISPENLKKIYDPFFTTKEPGKGTGLGLFLVQQIVVRNKGRISVESVVGKGTTFTLEFPAAEIAAEVAAG